ncbi:hypothetical protein M9H77_17480 [Catharanthus roseus]|uniref:Uncharacterized protein n=1 Tax=Catharanthus roseus TaxID=4058 RepID=A0ACC0B4Y6_CATRO|nr:hypothetical protein M9H77_17480 [Catharanthus roseus]
MELLKIHKVILHSPMVNFLTLLKEDKEIKSGSDNQTEIRMCHYCGQTGHLMVFCPNKQTRLATLMALLDRDASSDYSMAEQKTKQLGLESKPHPNPYKVALANNTSFKFGIGLTRGIRGMDSENINVDGGFVCSRTI